LENSRPIFSIVRQKFRAAAEIRQNRVGFCQDKAIIVENRRAAIGVDP
jgi:hypothetical protein